MEKFFQFSVSLLVALGMIIPIQSLRAETETRDLSGFNEISISGAVNVQVLSADMWSVVVTAPDGQTEYLVTELVNNGQRLAVSRNFAFFDSGTYQIVVQLPDLTSLSISGSADVSVSNLIADSFDLEASGPVELNAGQLQVDRLSVETIGPVDIVVSGIQGESMRVSAVGPADLDLGIVDLDQLRFEAIGSADLEARGQVSQLNVQMTGGSELHGQQLRVETLTGKLIGGAEAHVVAESSNLVGMGPGTEMGLASGDLDMNDIGIWVPIDSVIMVFGMPVLIVFFYLRYRYKSRMALHETLRQYAASGAEIPLEIQQRLLEGAAPGNPLRSGITLVAIGAGIGLTLLILGAGEAAALGLIPGFIGAARLIIWKIESRK